MFEKAIIRQKEIAPALFLAPMAGITHSAFRRLVADFGGCGALFTEMLSGSAVIQEKLDRSPFTLRRDCEGPVVYQLLFNGAENIETAIKRLSACNPFGIDCNCACPAPEIRKQGSGAALFRDYDRLAKVIERMRNAWDGLFTVKCRLGDDAPGWEQELERRLSLFARIGVDACIMHPRFFGDKLKRRARWSLFPRIAAMSDLPIIANGDITCLSDLTSHAKDFASTAGVMIGRMAAVKPWIFRELRGEPPALDYAAIWQRFYEYICEDFIPQKALGRLKQFTAYYARNFFFGHDLYRATLPAASLEEIHDKAMAFLERNPRVSVSPGVAGI